MSRKILVVFDSLNIPQEVVRYAIGLAKRTEAELTLFLILYLNLQNSQNSLLEEAKWKNLGRKALLPAIFDIRQAGVQVTEEISVGDPSSEFLKFIARNYPFQTIIWGGSKNLLESRSHKGGGHWLMQIKNNLNCPLVIPSGKP